MAQSLAKEREETILREKLQRENRVLTKIILLLEWPLTLLMTAAGVCSFMAHDSSAMLTAAGFAILVASMHSLYLLRNRHKQRKLLLKRSGEVRVAGELQRTLSAHAELIHDVIVHGDGDVAQIDHIAITNKAVFILETKDWDGSVRGDDRDPYWHYTERRSGASHAVQNPFRQNDYHLHVVEHFLQESHVRGVPVIPMVVNAGSDTQWDIRHAKNEIYVLAEVPDVILGVQTSAELNKEMRHELAELFRHAMLKD